MQLLGVLVGTIVGIIWEFLSTTQFKTHETLLPSLIINSSSKTVHFHHWLAYFGLIIVVVFLSIKSQKLLHPAVLMVLSFLISAIVYDFWKYPDWSKLIK